MFHYRRIMGRLEFSHLSKYVSEVILVVKVHKYCMYRTYHKYVLTPNLSVIHKMYSKNHYIKSLHAPWLRIMYIFVDIVILHCNFSSPNLNYVHLELIIDF